MAQVLETGGLALAAKLHRLAPLPQECSPEDVVSVWEYVSQFIEKQMLQNKGVVLPGLGTFTFSRKQLNIGNGSLVVQRPVFILSQKLQQMYSLTATRHFTSGDVQVVPLNFSAIALDSPYSRDLVQTCYQVISAAIPRAVQTNSKLDLCLPSIGHLSIVNQHVKMKFFKEFVTGLDGSGNMERVLRFDSRGARSNPSIMSRAASHVESRSASTLTLPRIIATSTTTHPPTGQLAAVGEEEKEMVVSEEGELVDTEKAGNKKRVKVKSQEQLGLKASVTIRPPSQDTRQRPSPPRSRPSTCSHNNSGQELCYLCHQRAVTNVPVSFAKEIARQQQVENQLLFEYQKQQDEIAMAKDRMRALQARKFAEKTSQYNWTVAKEKMEMASRHPKEDYQPSFLMHQRPTSPPSCLRQAAYGQELYAQMTERLRDLVDTRRNRELEERFDRIRQAEQIQASHLAYLKKKQLEKEEYQKALQHQLENKPEELPRFEPDSNCPIFGNEKKDIENYLDGKAAAQEVMRDQLVEMDRKRRVEEERARAKKEMELAALKRTKEELVEDNLQQGIAQRKIEEELVSSWQVEAAAKKQRDRADQADQHHPSTFILHQCQQYDRCHQCQRRKDAGAGVSHLVKDTRYLPGCKMVT